MRKIMVIGIIVVIISVMMCGCIEYKEPEPISTIKVSGMEGIYNFSNGKCEKVMVSGIRNTVYVDRYDEVWVSGINNEIIRR